MDLTGSFWTNLLPRVKNEATIKVFASQASEESDWETTAYGLSKRLVSRSRLDKGVQTSCDGAIAKRLCPGLQIRLDQFDSGSRLQKICGNSSVGRAIPCQGIGRRFEPVFPLQVFEKGKLRLPFFLSVLKVGRRATAGACCGMLGRCLNQTHDSLAGVASVVKLVDTSDLKSAACNGRTGSIPVRGTIDLIAACKALSGLEVG